MQPHSTGRRHAGRDKCCKFYNTLLSKLAASPIPWQFAKTQGALLVSGAPWVRGPAAGAAGSPFVLHVAMHRLCDLVMCRFVAFWELCRQGAPCS